MKKKINKHAVGRILIRGCVSLALLAVAAHAQEKASKHSAVDEISASQSLDQQGAHQSAAPLTADALMEKLLQITASPEGAVRKNDVERIFETKFTHRENVAKIQEGGKEERGI
ncbi:hypothetical protein LBW46_24415, partial [Ralstonia solanacearum]